MRNFNNRLCRTCNASYTPITSNQKYCGSIRSRIGCSYKNKQYLAFLGSRKYAQKDLARKRAQGLSAYHRLSPEQKRIRHLNSWRSYQAGSVKRRYAIRVQENSVTLEQWEWIKRLFDYCCASCGEKGALTLDHKIPLSKGGLHTWDNIQPLCSSCNSRKYTKTWFAYLNINKTFPHVFRSWTFRSRVRYLKCEHLNSR